MLIRNTGSRYGTGPHKNGEFEKLAAMMMGGLKKTGTKRPQSGDMQPKDSTELRSFLENIGLSIQEFEDMRREEPPQPSPTKQGDQG